MDNEPKKQLKHPRGLRPESRIFKLSQCQHIHTRHADNRALGSILGDTGKVPGHTNCPGHAT